MTLRRISLVIPPVGPWRAQARWYRWAEDVGYDVAYTYDHLTHATARGEWLGEAFTTLTAAAGAPSASGWGPSSPPACSAGRSGSRGRR